MVNFLKSAHTLHLQLFKCPQNEIMGCHFIVSRERPFDTERNAIYRFSVSFLFQSYNGLKTA